jgi:hypothetical protein
MSIATGRDRTAKLRRSGIKANAFLSSSGSPMCSHAAPTELGRFMENNFYRHGAPTELAQVSNLLYRRASSLQILRQFGRARCSGDLPIGNRRYGPLEILVITHIFFELILILLLSARNPNPVGGGLFIV